MIKWLRNIWKAQKLNRRLVGLETAVLEILIADDILDIVAEGGGCSGVLHKQVSDYIRGTPSDAGNRLIKMKSELKKEFGVASWTRL